MYRTAGVAVCRRTCPTIFFVNIPPDERAPFIDFLKARGAQTSRVLPMIRGRLTAINDRPVEGAQSAGDGENFAAREQNLTWTAELGSDNTIVAGRWWTREDFGSRSCLWRQSFRSHCTCAWAIS